MRAYTYQIGEGVGDAIETPIHPKPLFADSLGKAIEAEDAYPLWASSASAAREA